MLHTRMACCCGWLRASATLLGYSWIFTIPSTMMTTENRMRTSEATFRAMDAPPGTGPFATLAAAGSAPPVTR